MEKRRTSVKGLASFITAITSLVGVYLSLPPVSAVDAAFIFYAVSFALGVLLIVWLGPEALSAIGYGALAAALLVAMLFLLVSPFMFVAVALLVAYAGCVAAGAFVVAKAKGELCAQT